MILNVLYSEELVSLFKKREEEEERKQRRGGGGGKKGEREGGRRREEEEGGGRRRDLWRKRNLHPTVIRDSLTLLEQHRGTDPLGQEQGMHRRKLHTSQQMF